MTEPRHGTEPADNPEERWQRTFHLEQWQREQLREQIPGAAEWLDQIDGVSLASQQLAIDAGVLADLDAELNDPTCEHREGCTFPAAVQLRCKHTRNLIGLLCGAHAEKVRAMPSATCQVCHHQGLPGQLFALRSIFTRRSTA